MRLFGRKKASRTTDMDEKKDQGVAEPAVPVSATPVVPQAPTPEPAAAPTAAPAQSAAPSHSATPAVSATPAESAATDEKLTPEKLEEMVIDAMRTVYDPEIPVNIYDLGLIYDLRIDESNNVAVKMTLTTPMCPVAGQMPGMIEQAIRMVHAVNECEIDLIWEPPWNPDMMTEAARLQLNI